MESVWASAGLSRANSRPAPSKWRISSSKRCLRSAMDLSRGADFAASVGKERRFELDPPAARQASGDLEAHPRAGRVEFLEFHADVFHARLVGTDQGLHFGADLGGAPRKAPEQVANVRHPEIGHVDQHTL